MQFFLFLRAMSFSVYHILPWEFHCSVLFLARSIVNVFIITRLKYFHFWLRGFNNVNIIVMSFEIQIGNDIAVYLLGYFQGYAISLSKTTSLPCSQYVKETAQTNHNEYRHWASCPIARWVMLRAHDFVGTVPRGSLVDEPCHVSRNNFL